MPSFYTPVNALACVATVGRTVAAQCLGWLFHLGHVRRVLLSRMEGRSRESGAREPYSGRRRRREAGRLRWQVERPWIRHRIDENGARLKACPLLVVSPIRSE